MKGVIVAALMIAAPVALGAQATGWRHVHTTDDLTGREDDRLILRADGTPELAPASDANAYQGAALILICGDRLPGDSRRTLLVFAGEALMPYGDDRTAYAKVRFDKGKPVGMDLPMLDWEDAIVLQTSHSSNRRTVYLGDHESPHFSEPVLRQLLQAKTLSMEFAHFGHTRRVVFAVAGLAEQLDSLSGCRWPGAGP